MVIEELKAKAGFGGAKLEIAVPEDQYSNNETIKGELTLSGGKVSQKIQALNIRLIREWSTEYYTTDMNIAQTPVAGIMYPVVTSVQSQYELEEDRGKDVVLTLSLPGKSKLIQMRRKALSLKLTFQNSRKNLGPMTNGNFRPGLIFLTLRMLSLPTK